MEMEKNMSLKTKTVPVGLRTLDLIKKELRNKSRKSLV